MRYIENTYGFNAYDILKISLMRVYMTNEDKLYARAKSLDYEATMRDSSTSLMQKASSSNSSVMRKASVATSNCMVKKVSSSAVAGKNRQIVSRGSSLKGSSSSSQGV